MKIFSGLYTLYASVIFLILCLVFVPVLSVLCQRQAWHPLALRIHNVWAWSFFLLMLIRVKIDRRSPSPPGQQCIYCANHFSYLDIPVLLLVMQAKFIGKSSLARVPLFGYFFGKTHISVDRASFRSRAESFLQARQAVSEGFSIAFFPEGGVKVKEEAIPCMFPFRDGAFRLAAEKNIPIVPVTIPFNHLIVPDKIPLRVHHHSCKLVIHPPVYPYGTSEGDIRRLKETVFKIIQDELIAHHPDKMNRVG